MISLTTLGSPYTENFDTLAATGTSSVLPSGWGFTEAGTNANTLYTAGTGSSNAGDTYSFGAAGSTERALGGLLSGSLTPTFGASFTNLTGGTITSLAISYVGEMWRAGVTNRGASDRLDFQISFNATSLTSGTWADVNALDFSSPATGTSVGALNGNAAANRTALSTTIADLNVGNGATIWIRWTDFNITSSDDGLAIDDFSLTAQGTGPVTPSVNLSVSTNSASEAAATVVTVTATASQAVATDQTVTLSVAGSVLAGDYTLSATTITIPAGLTSGTVTFSVVNDNDVEGTEQATLSISNPSAGIVLGATVQQTIDITDDDVVVTPIKIHDIQGAGATSPLAGSIVTIEAIVVGDFQGSSRLGGFFVQEEDSDTDADALTSEGLFIFQGASGTNVNVGDKVRVTGTVVEFTGGTSSLTELSSITNVVVLSTGNPLPAATALSFPVASTTSLEALEGMRVQVSNTLAVTQTDFGPITPIHRFGNVVLSSDGAGNAPGTDARLDTYTQFNTPDAAGYAAYQGQLALRRIVLDDGSDDSYVDPIAHGRDGNPLSAANTLRGGDTVTNLSGIVDDRFGNADIGAYRIQPTGPVDFDATNARAAAPEVGGSLRVASFNVLNYFNGDGLGGGFPTPRGADSLTEFGRQQAKIISALVGLNADVVGLVEIENDGYGPASAIASLVNALNAATSPGLYAFVNPGAANMGTDQIAVGFIYKPSSVSPKGAAATLTSAFVDPDPDFVGGGDGFNSAVQRPSLAQTFEVLATGAVFTPVINHFKSKGSSAGGPGDADTGDGQGPSNGTRARAADTLMDWLKTDPTGSGDKDFLILGDLNAYAMEDPIREIRSGADDVVGTADDFANLIGNAGYSYGFAGQWGALDHALASGSLQAQVTGAADWHINADEPSALDYNLENKNAGQQASLYAPNAYRSSDHDPLVVGLNLGISKPGTVGNDTITGTTGNDELGGGAGRDMINGGAGRDTITGGSGRDVLTGGADADAFVYVSVVDAGDQIMDFQLGIDRLVVTQLMANLGYAGNNPGAAGYLIATPAAGMTNVMYDPDGSAGAAVPRLLVTLMGVVTDNEALLLDPPG